MPAASLKDPDVTASLVATDDAKGVIFRSTPKARRTSHASGPPTRYGWRTSHHPKRVSTCFVRMLWTPGASGLRESDDMTSPMCAAMPFEAASASLSSKRGISPRRDFASIRSTDSTSSIALTSRGLGSVSLRLPFF